jgi:hypothetical protein
MNRLLAGKVNPRTKIRGQQKHIPSEPNRLPTNQVAHQANNCLNQPSPSQDNLLQILNLIRKLLALSDNDQEFHATPPVPGGWIIKLLNRNYHNIETQGRQGPIGFHWLQQPQEYKINNYLSFRKSGSQ